MLRRVRNWQRRRVLARHPIDARAWTRVTERVPFLGDLNEDEETRLKGWTALFLHEKRIHGAGGYEVDEETRLVIGAQACLLILNLDLDYYKDWVEVIVYPDEFIPEREYMDEAGVVHTVREPLAGESWLQGPVILSAADVDPSWHEGPVNVVIHEFAHKLDMLNGDANGMPPLHPDMDPKVWKAAFEQAYQDLRRRVGRGLPTPIDPYGAEAPGEFFAVASEAFFQAPRTLQAAYPAVYEQMRQFYRQDPAARGSGHG